MMDSATETPPITFLQSMNPFTDCALSDSQFVQEIEQASLGSFPAYLQPLIAVLEYPEDFQQTWIPGFGLQGQPMPDSQ
jgi:hypothetical protein